MNEATHLQMHGDHKHWLSESALWQDEITVWHDEVQRALGEVNHLAKALRDHAAALNDHGKGIAGHDDTVRSHEGALAGWEKGAPGGELVSLATAHDKEAEQRAALRQVHQRVRKFHHTLLAQWNLLLAAVTKADLS